MDSIIEIIQGMTPRDAWAYMVMLSLLMSDFAAVVF